MLINKNKYYEPTRGTKYSAGIDVASSVNITICPNEIVLVPTGLFIDCKSIKQKVKKSKFIGIHIRSSVALKGISLANMIGVVDMDYKDEIKIMLINNSSEDIDIYAGDRLAQLILHNHSTELFGIKSKNKRTGGFGSTSNK